MCISNWLLQPRKCIAFLIVFLSKHLCNTYRVNIRPASVAAAVLAAANSRFFLATLSGKQLSVASKIEVFMAGATNYIDPLPLTHCFIESMLRLASLTTTSIGYGVPNHFLASSRSRYGPTSRAYVHTTIETMKQAASVTTTSPRKVVYKDSFRYMCLGYTRPAYAFC